MKRIPISMNATSMPITPYPTGVSSFRARLAPNWRELRSFIYRHDRLLVLTRMLSALLWLGPWRAWAIRYFQRRAANPPLPRMSSSYFGNSTALDSRLLVAQLETEGFARGLQLPEAVVDEVLAYCAAHPQSRHSNPHLTCLAIQRLALDPALLEVIKTYLGAEPLLYTSQMYWTHPPACEEKRQVIRQRKTWFHYDVGDFKQLNVFFYLTDVDNNCGPHMLIQGTQQSKSWRQLLTRFLSDEEATARYGDRIITLTGPRGSGFFVNLACYHKHAFGTQTRLMLGLTYVLQRSPSILPPVLHTDA